MLKAVNGFLGANAEQATTLLLPLIHINLAVYACAFWMQQPVMPAKIKALGASEVEYGSLQSASATFALLGSTLMGRIVDVQGARTGLVLAQLGSALLYLITAHATSVEQLYLTAVPAFFQHAMLCCSAAIAALSTADSRALALGRLSFSYGIGMALGSPLGGVIATQFSIETAFHSAALVSFIIVLLNLVFLPDLRPSTPQPASASANGLDVAAIFRVALKPGVRDLLIISFSSGIATSAFRSMFALGAVDQLGLSSQDLGFLMSFNAVIGLITNVFLVAWAVRWIGEGRTLVISLIGQAAAFLAMSHVHGDLISVTIVSVPQAIASTFFYTLSSSLMTKCVESNEQGTVVSLGHATRSGTQVMAPLLGSFVMKLYKFQGVCLTAAIITLGTGLFSLAVFGSTRTGNEYKDHDGQSKLPSANAEEKTRVD